MGTTVKPTQVNSCVYEETCTLIFDNIISEGSAFLNMSFKGVLNDKMTGFYRTKITKDGFVSYNLVTQFEATNARQCFPCWDEPALKATFDVTLNVPKDLVALSNMTVVLEEVLGDSVTKKVVFDTSKMMSTYLLAFVVGEFDYVHGDTNDGIKVKVYTPPGKSSQGEYPLNVAIKSVDFFTNFFDYKYPMKKLDLIAIADFGLSAMENWGLIIYNESALLADVNEFSEAQKQWVTTMVCHEVCHQWFGNLVTMEWWNYLWLNEGFATFMQYEAAHAFNPDFEIWDQFVCDETIRSLELDSLKNSHAIETSVKHPEEVDEIFDAISYQKGGNIIRMIYFWIGADKFKEGMQLYFKRHEYSSTKPEQLWNCFDEVSKKKRIKNFMSNWTNQMGFPVINVSVASQNDNFITLNVSQEKFVLSPIDGGSDIVWQVPITITTSANNLNGSKEHQLHLLKSKFKQITVKGVTENDWLKINSGFCGFYRVNYSPDLYFKLVGAIKINQLSCCDRLNIVNDVSTMASTGQVPLATYFNLLKNFKDEKSYPVWKEIIKSIGRITKLLWNNDEFSQKFSLFKNNLFSNIMTLIGMEAKQGESHFDARLRGLLITASNDDQVNKMCMEMMNNFFKNSISVNPEIRAPIYEVYVSKGGLQAYENMVALHQKVHSIVEKRQIEIALGCVEDLECLQRAQQYMMTKHVRDNEKYVILRSMANKSKLGRDESWTFVKEQWDVFYEKSSDNHHLSRIIDASTANFATKEMLKDVKDFLSNRISRNCEKKFKQCVEKIEFNIQFCEQNEQALKDYFP